MPPRIVRLTTLLFLAAAAVGWAVFLAFGPDAVARAHRGESAAFLNRLFASRRYTADDYTTRIFHKLLEATLVGGGILASIWGVWRPRVAGICFAIGGIAYGLVGFFADPSGYYLRRLLYREGSVTETCSWVSWLLASFLFARAFFVTGRNRPWLLAAAALFFLFAGEEVSWMQRVIGYDTPDAVEEMNKQREFNIHNLGHSCYFNAAFLMLVALLGIVFPRLAANPERQVGDLRALALVFAAYFAIGVILPRREGQEFMRGIMAIPLGLLLLIAATSGFLFAKGPIALLIRSFLGQVRFDGEVASAARLLVVVYVAVGLRYLTLGDLLVQSRLGYNAQIDDELIEMFGGVIAVMIAGRQTEAATDRKAS